MIFDLGIICQEGLLLMSSQGEVVWSLARCTNMFIACPAAKFQLGKATAWGIPDKVAFSWKSCMDFSDWRCIPFEWLSPMRMVALSRGAVLANFPPMVALQSGPEQPLLQFAARQAFWEIGKATLQRIATAEFNQSLTSDTLAGKAFELIKLVLCCSDDEAARCLEARASITEEDRREYHAVLDTQDAQDCLEKDDQLAAAKEIQTLKEQEQLRNEILSIIRAKCKRTAGATSSRGSQGSRSKKAEAKRVPIKTALPGDDDSITGELVCSLGPPDCSFKIYKDLFNGRWISWWRSPGSKSGSWFSKSQSWGNRSHTQCVKACLAEAWNHAEAWGMSCPYDFS